MKKIVLDETQVDRLMKHVVSEQITDNNRYRQEVRCSFDYHNLKFSEDEIIDWIDDVKFNVSFAIDMEGKSYGIKGITIGNVLGPEEIEVDVTVLINGQEDPETYPSVILKPNWSDTVVEYDTEIGWIGIDHYIEMELIQSEYEGSKLAVSKIIVHAKEM